MIKTERGQVVTVASLAGLVGVNKLADYCSSKFAAVGFDESLRIEFMVKFIFVSYTQYNLYLVF